MHVLRITCLWMRAKTSTRRSGSSCARWWQKVRTTSSSPRTPTSGSTANACRRRDATESRSSAALAGSRSTTAPRRRICSSQSECSKAASTSTSRRTRRDRGLSIGAEGSGAPPRGDRLDHRGAGAGGGVVAGWLAGDVVPETIGILVRDAAQANQISRGLEERGVPVRVITESGRTVETAAGDDDAPS